jgi:hypothetical protein
MGLKTTHGSCLRLRRKEIKITETGTYTAGILNQVGQTLDFWEVWTQTHKL